MAMRACIDAVRASKIVSSAADELATGLHHPARAAILYL
jgi:hypothetical protein